MTLCQSCSWPLIRFSSWWNMLLSCSVTDSNCRQLTLLSRADLSAFCRCRQTWRSSGYEAWERPSGWPESVQQTLFLSSDTKRLLPSPESWNKDLHRSRLLMERSPLTISLSTIDLSALFSCSCSVTLNSSCGKKK